MRRALRVVPVTTLVIAGCMLAPGAARAASTSCHLPTFGPGTSYRPAFEPGRHTARVTNPWFPLRPGTTWIYTGRADGARTVDVVVASHHTRVIGGVRARVVHDRLYQGGRLVERTRDYYAQDRCGNVWYFGEDTAELDASGHVTSRQGTWHAGHDGAQPGVFMPMRPRTGQRFRQEWLAGQAEDVFSVAQRHTTVSTPTRRYRHALRTRETSDLEPGIVDAKFYVRGIGEVAERSVRGGSDDLTLDAVQR